MKFDITGDIKNYQSKVIKLPPRTPRDKETTLGWYNIIYNAFHSTEKKIQVAEEKQMAFKITQRAAVKPEKLKLNAKDLAFLMKRIELVHDPLILGRAKQLFEGWQDEELLPPIPEQKGDNEKEEAEKVAAD